MHSLSVTEPELREPTPKQSLLLFKLKRQRRLIVFVAIPTFILLAAGVQLLPPTYKTSVTVMVESRTPRPPVRGSETAPELPVPFAVDILGTEMAIIGSRETMSQTVGRLHLMDNPYFNPYLQPGLLTRWSHRASAALSRLIPRASDTGITGPERAWSDTVDSLIRSVKLEAVPRSRVIEITSYAGTKELVAEISNTIADIYLRAHFGLTREINVDAQNFLVSRLRELKDSSASAAQAVENYRVEHGLEAGATNTLLQEQMTALSSQLLNERARLDALQSEYDSAKTRSPEELPAVINSATMTRLQEVQAVAASKYADMLSRFGPGAPQVRAYESVLNSVQAQIAAEAKRKFGSLKTDLEAATASVQALMNRASDLQARLSEMGIARAHLDTLSAESAAAHNLYSAFLNRAKETDANLLFPASDVRVISKATVPSRPWFLQNRLMLPAAAFASMLIGCTLGLLVESRRKGVVSTLEIERLFRLNTIGTLPLRDPGMEDVHRDSVEHLLNRIYFGLGANSVLVTSSLPKEGKSTISRALADAACERALRVLLIDADLRSVLGRPGTGATLLGLSEVLRGEVTAQQVMRTEPPSNLTFLPAGRLRENPIRLFSLPPARRLLETLAAQFDLVIVDGPPIMAGGDCWMLSQLVRQTVLVVEWNATPAGAIEMAIKQLFGPRERTDARYEDHYPCPASIAGVVLNKVDLSKTRRLGSPESVMFDRSLVRYRRGR